eukprot:TRINITY_DN30008_c0_g1_i1.p1 TRINITY_DN30008_c0_g1~~TRINITY_DN30008_c0_g1_i1.p1  ORF type:complete len:265 (+),score=40.18 TRINITY_DN30008_c0_g1_i1:81-875(+)
MACPVACNFSLTTSLSRCEVRKSFSSPTQVTSVFAHARVSSPSSHVASSLRSLSTSPSSSRSLSHRVNSLASFSSTYNGIPSSSLLPSLLPSTLKQSSALRVRARGGDGSVDFPQRAIAALAYFLPLLDGMRYGKFLFIQYPVTYKLIEPLTPIIRAYNSFPYAGFIAFFVLYILIIQNQSYSRYVRFNCMQAVVLDVLMILPSLIERLIPSSRGLAFDFIVLLNNTVFIYLIFCFGYGVIYCLLGRTPKLPIVADAAEAQVPF